jgi:type I restriction enzyme S subunit
MKLETFFDKFDQFADAPDAVAKMRELVLGLAVTGKLVAQDKRDEPASLLLESTKAEREMLIAAKKIKSRTSSPVEPDEQSFERPSGWAWARLSDVGCELGQKVPDKRFTYIDIGGIDSDKGRISDRVEKLEPGEAPSRARKLVVRGTVIYSMVRPYLLNIAIVDKNFDPEPIASTAFGILLPFAGINNRYLFYWLRSAPFTAYAQAGMKGMAYPAINDEKFYSGPIALPPLAEQKRIVAKVDELMALCDRLEAQQQERETRHAALARASLARFADAPTPANLPFLFHTSYTIPPADLRKAILTLAVQGKLVPQDPNDEPVAELLTRLVLLTARGGKIPKALTPIDTDALPFDIPFYWKWAQAQELCRAPHIITYGVLKPVWVEVGVPTIRVQDIQNGEIVSEGIGQCSPERAAKFAKTTLETGDILIAKDGATLGKTAFVPPSLAGGNITQHVLRFKVDPILRPGKRKVKLAWSRAWM